MTVEYAESVFAAKRRNPSVAEVLRVWKESDDLS